MNTASLLPVRFQLLPQPLVLYKQQLHLVGLLQASRWQCVERVVAWKFSRLTRLDIPKRETMFSTHSVCSLNVAQAKLNSLSQT